MTRMTGPDCVVMCNLINTHTHTHTQLFIHIADSIIKRSPLRIEINRFGKQHLLQEKNYEYCKPLDLHTGRAFNGEPALELDLPCTAPVILQGHRFPTLPARVHIDVVFILQPLSFVVRLCVACAVGKQPNHRYRPINSLGLVLYFLLFTTYY